MKLSLSALAGALTLVGASPLEKRSSVQGFDVSNYQPNADFRSAYSSGARFVLIKATEGISYIDPNFASHWKAAGAAGLIRGAYHFAHPDESSGSAQASFFMDHGGSWSNDGKILPGMLDIEYAPSGGECYGLSQSSMVSWITDFANTYHKSTARWPLIYSTADWWNTCTGNSKAFSDNCPLVLADYNSSPGTIPGGWPSQTIWQYSDSYKYGGDSDEFNGSEDDLNKLATG